MPNFPVLDLEDLVQEGDKTRLDASKSYASGGSQIDSIEITPSLLEDPVDVTAAQKLDWQYDFEFDVGTGVNAKLEFEEAGTPLTATLTQGTYTPAELAAEIQARMRAVSAIDYVVTVDDDNAFTFEGNGTTVFALLPLGGSLPDQSILSEIGFSEDTEAKTEHTGEAVETIYKRITLTLTEDGTPDDIVTEKSYLLPIISEAADHLFSSDDKLRRHEENIMSYVPDGRSTWKNAHRRAQDLIITWLDDNGYWGFQGQRITPKRIQDVKEVTDWATFLTLQLIFENIRNAVDDVFGLKAEKYERLVPVYRNKALLRMDVNEDGEVDIGEGYEIRNAIVVRR